MGGHGSGAEGKGKIGSGEAVTDRSTSGFLLVGGRRGICCAHSGCSARSSGTAAWGQPPLLRAATGKVGDERRTQ